MSFHTQYGSYVGSFVPFPPYATDSYKLSHASMYPEDTKVIFSNFTPRSNKHFNVPEKYKDNKYVVYGVEEFIYNLFYYWNENFFKLKESDFERKILTFKEVVTTYCGPEEASNLEDRFIDLYNNYDSIFDVLEFKYVKSGTVLDINVPCLTVRNIDDKFYWLVNYLETYISTELWKPMTTATTARFYRKFLDYICKKTGGIPELVDWQAHDFSMRGLPNFRDSLNSATSHLLYFTGTDNICADVSLRESMSGGGVSIVGGSVPATEHSVACSYLGSVEDSSDDSDKLEKAELNYLNNILDMYPSGIVSIVSDTWDYFKLISEYAARPDIKSKIMSRSEDQFGNCKTVFRPDSGDPVKIICGDPEAKKGSPENLGSLQILWDTFGGTITETGHKLLDKHVGLIYGDSITPHTLVKMFETMDELGWCSSNLVVGVGSYTYSYMTRDTLGFAMKATYVKVGDKEFAIYKDPKTDDGTKKSAKGLLYVDLDGKLVDGITNLEDYKAAIVKGSLLIDYVDYAPSPSLGEIRASLRKEASN